MQAFLRPAEIEQGYTPVVAAFTGGEYAPLFAACRDSFLAGNETAPFIPAVEFLVRSTLAIMQQPSVIGRLPLEVARRSKLAEDCSRQVGAGVAQTGLLLAVYGRDEAMSPILRRDPGELVLLTARRGVFEASRVIGIPRRVHRSRRRAEIYAAAQFAKGARPPGWCCSPQYRTACRGKHGR